MPEANLHATAVLLGDHGVLITGDSGSGKTTLAFALIEQFHSASRFACLVGDDQLLLSARHGRLLCRVPPSIAGLAEVHGLGPVPFAFEAVMVADLLVRLVPAAEAARYPEDAEEVLMGCPVPRLDLAAGNARGAAAAVASRLSRPPFR